MTGNAILRLLDTFFRHPFLHLLPIVAFAALGNWYMASQEPVYRTGGIVLVDDQALLNSVTGVQGSQTAWQTPSQFTSEQLNSLLQTDTFVLAVAERAGLGDRSTLNGAQIDALRGSIGSWSTGRDLVYVWAEHLDADVAKALADATIQSLVQWKIDSEVSSTAAAEGVLDPLTERYRQELADARAALEDYLDANRPPPGGERTERQQLDIEDLTMTVTDANIRYSQALANEESARLAAAHADSVIRSRFQVLDEPPLPSMPQTSLKNLAMALAAFLFAGMLLSLASVVVATLTDRTVRFRADVVDRLGVDVVAVIPALSKRERNAVGASS